MAAAEYYNFSGTGPVPTQSQFSRPPQQGGGGLRPPASNAPRPNSQLQNNSSLAPPYPLSDAPPPYSAYNQDPQPRPHSQPPPLQRPIFPSSNGPSQQPQQPPYYHPGDTHAYPAEKLPSGGAVPQRPSTLQNTYRPSDFTGTYPPPQQQQQPPPPPQQTNGYVAPGLSQVYGAGPQQQNFYRPGGPVQQQQPPPPPPPPQQPGVYFAQQPQIYPPPRSRSRSRDRKHHHHSNKPRPDLQRKKSSGVNTFLGAGGGAIIGDLIFPGMGTIGGAILGGLGGHEYGKNKGRAQSNPGRYRPRSYSSGEGGYEEDYRRGRK